MFKRSSFIALPGKRGYSGLLPQTVCPVLEGTVKSLIVFKKQHDQLMDGLVVG